MRRQITGLNASNHGAAEQIPDGIYLVRVQRVHFCRQADEGQLVGLRGVVKISSIVFHGNCQLRLDGFAPASRWEELSPTTLDSPEVA